MAKIQKLMQSGTVVFPATITDAVKLNNALGTTYPAGTLLTNVLSGLLNTAKNGISITEATGTGDIYKTYTFTGVTGNTGVISIPKDRYIESVALNTANQTLDFTFSISGGLNKTISVDVSKFVMSGEVGNGIQMSSNLIGVKVDNTGEFLYVDSNGLRLSGVTSAINTAKANAKTATTNTVNAVISGALSGVVKANTDLGNKLSSLETTEGQLSANINTLSGQIATVSGTANSINTTLSGKATSGELYTQTQNINDLSGFIYVNANGPVKKIDELSGQIRTLSGRVYGDEQALTSGASSLSGKLKTNTNNINSLSDKVNTLSGSIKTNTNNINALSGNIKNGSASLSGRLKAANDSISSTAQTFLTSYNNLSGSFNEWKLQGAITTQLITDNITDIW